MLTGVISYSVISSNVGLSTLKATATTIGLPQYWSEVITGLLILLYLKEVLSSTGKWNRHLNDSFNIAIIPLVFSFIGVIIFEIRDILYLLR
jgi:hypothetical protein